MALRMIEIVVDEDGKDRVLDALRRETSASPQEMLFWQHELTDGRLCARLVVDDDEAGAFLDGLEKRFMLEKDYRIAVYPLQATIPRLHEPAEEKERVPRGKGGDKKPRPPVREELYAQVQDMAEPGLNYLLLVLFSAAVAAVGMWRGSTAVVVGAMVIAPLLGPNLGLALASTLGDAKLARVSLMALGAGTVVALAVGLAAGVLLDFDLLTEELASRTRLGIADAVLALAAGGAGALSLAGGAISALVGVTVALSLLPPLVAAGMLAGAGALLPATRAGMLFVANLVFMNMAGIVVFTLRGVRPLRISEQKQARRVVARSLVIWLVLSLLLAASVAFLQRGGPLN